MEDGKMKVRRYLSLLMCVMLFVSLLGIPARAADEEYADAKIISVPLPKGSFPAASSSNSAAGATTYTPSESSGMYLFMTADGKNWILPMADNAGNTLNYTVSSCRSEDTGIISVKVVDGKCVATSKRAGLVRVTITSSSKNCSTVWTVISRFTDVTNSDSYYYWPVYWALNYGITTGKTATTFLPGSACTRGQIVTFLYRYYGSPSVPATASNPFKDIKQSDYFYKAVLWAYNKGITTGTSATTFSPNNACTREQCVTFLWRAAGKPSTSASNPFWDVQTGTFYYDAVRWAVANEITTGRTATVFGVGQTCTRGQIVTFLHRGRG